MRRFIETICFERGTYPLLNLHQERVEKAFAAHFPGLPPHKLQQILPALDFTEKYKVRVVYDAEQADIEYSEYLPRTITRIKLIRNNEVDYTHKYEDRSALQTLFSQKDDTDEILIIKNGYVTDTFFANPAFRKGDTWCVPDTCLLDGVRRRSLLLSGKVQAVPISEDDVHSYDEISLINALNDLGEIRIPTHQIMK